MRKSFRASVPAILVVLAAGLPAFAQQSSGPTAVGGVTTEPGKARAIEAVQSSATIVALDAPTRMITLKRDDGKVVSIKAGDQVRNFDKLKVGDVVKTEYTQAIALDLRKGGGGKTDVKESTSVMSAPPGGDKLGGTAVREVSVLADVVAVDAAKKTVTLKGPGGNLIDMLVRDPEQLKGIKKGDQVQALYTESLAISVDQTKK